MNDFIKRLSINSFVCPLMYVFSRRYNGKYEISEAELQLRLCGFQTTLGGNDFEPF